MSIVTLVAHVAIELVAGAGHLRWMDEQALTARFARRGHEEPAPPQASGQDAG